MRLRQSYSREVRITSEKLAAIWTDWLDDEVCKLCREIAKALTNEIPDIEEFSTLMYEHSDVGGIRNALIEGAQDAMDCELVFDY